MTFWSGETLAEQLPTLVDPFDVKQIDCASYRLRVGPEVYVSPTDDAKDAKTRSKLTLKEGEAFTIPAGQFAFLLTEERVTVPDIALAFISVRAKFKFRGLVNVSGFHVDPGYQGRLVFSVFNAGPGPVHLARGDDCFLIWYASLDRKTERAKTGSGFEGIPTSLINPIAGEIQSLAGLSKRIEAISNQQKIIHVIAGLVAAGLVGWFFRGPATPAVTTVPNQIEQPVPQKAQNIAVPRDKTTETSPSGKPPDKIDPK